MLRPARNGFRGMFDQSFTQLWASIAMRQGMLLSGEIPMSLIVLKHCALWDGTSPEVREDMHVLVEGERIREISERSLTAPQAQVIDCQGKTLMPGLIDAHVHL